MIADARARGAAVLVSTHLRDLAMQVCENALVLRGGSTVAELQAHELVGEEGAGVYRALLDELRSSRSDLASLLAFRRTGLTSKSRRRMRVAGVVVLLLTVAAIVGPAYLGGSLPRERGGQLLALLPSMCLGFFVLAIFTAVASAGGREILPREQAVAFPVSTTTDHLGALMLAPLNIAWIAQAWTMLGITSYAVGPDRVWAYELPILLWVPRRHGARAGDRLGRRRRTSWHARHCDLPCQHHAARSRRHRPADDPPAGPGARPQPDEPAAERGPRQPDRALAHRGASAWSSSCSSVSAPLSSVPCLPTGRCADRCVRSCGWSPGVIRHGQCRTRTSR